MTSADSKLILELLRRGSLDRRFQRDLRVVDATIDEL